MISYLIDINVWLAMTWDLHPQHRGAARWYASTNGSPLLFCRFTMLGLLRLLTNQKVMGDSTCNIEEALQLYGRWVRDPRVELAPEPRGTEELFRRALASFHRQPATKAIADSYLVGFAGALGAELVTLDKGLARMASAQKLPAMLIRPV